MPTIGGEGLAEIERVRSYIREDETDAHWPVADGFSVVEYSAPVAKAAHHRRGVQAGRPTVGKIDVPELRLGIEDAQRQSQDTRPGISKI